MQKTQDIITTPVDIHLADLPHKRRLLPSVSSMNLILSPAREASYPSIKEFDFGAQNPYGWPKKRVTTLNESIFLNFARIFS